MPMFTYRTNLFSSVWILSTKNAADFPVVHIKTPVFDAKKTAKTTKQPFCEKNTGVFWIYRCTCEKVTFGAEIIFRTEFRRAPAGSQCYGKAYALTSALTSEHPAGRRFAPASTNSSIFCPFICKLAGVSLLGCFCRNFFVSLSESPYCFRRRFSSALSCLTTSA